MCSATPRIPRNGDYLVLHCSRSRSMARRRRSRSKLQRRELKTVAACVIVLERLLPGLVRLPLEDACNTKRQFHR